MPSWDFLRAGGGTERAGGEIGVQFDVRKRCREPTGGGLGVDSGGNGEIVDQGVSPESEVFNGVTESVIKSFAFIEKN